MVDQPICEAIEVGERYVPWRGRVLREQTSIDIPPRPFGKLRHGFDFLLFHEVSRNSMHF